MSKISVIMPAYNAGKYIQQSIDAVLSQTHHDLELILVDDGSTDNTVAACENSRMKDKRVKVISLPHSGEGTALNVGLSASDGEYVFFMSALDALGENNDLDRLLKLMNDNSADVAISNFYQLNNKNGETLIHMLDGKQHVYTPQEWFKFEYQTMNFMNNCFWNLYGKLFKRDLLEMADFTSDSNNVHDSNTWKFYVLANKIAYENSCMYVERDGVDDSPTYHFDLNTMNALSDIEERIAILTIIKFDISNDLTEYIRRLNYHRDHDLEHGDYYGYLNAVNKLEIIDKYKNQSKEND